LGNNKTFVDYSPTPAKEQWLFFKPPGVKREIVQGQAAMVKAVGSGKLSDQVTSPIFFRHEAGSTIMSGGLSRTAKAKLSLLLNRSISDGNVSFPKRFRKGLKRLRASFLMPESSSARLPRAILQRSSLKVLSSWLWMTSTLQ
jgi:hypothetical protein